MSFEQPSIERKAPTIENAKNFDELFEAIDALGEIKGSRRTYSAEELKRRINKFLAGETLPTEITRGEGLRDKVVELVYKKYEESKNEGTN